MKNFNKKTIFTSLFLVILLSFGLFIFFQPIFTSGFHNSQNGIGDTILNNYFLEHSFRIVFNPGYRASAWSPLFFFPQQNVLTFSDNLWGSAPIYWLMRTIFDSETAFQWWMILVSICSFVAFYLLARSLKVQTIFAGYGSFLFAFCLPRLAQIGHQQLLPQFYSALALLFFFRFLEKRQFKYFVFFESFIFLQLLAGFYLGWFLLLSLMFLIPVSIYCFRDKTILKLFFNIKTLIATLIFLAITAVTFFPYYQTQQELGRRSYADVQSMIPSLDSYVNVVSSSIFYQFYPDLMKIAAEDLPMRHEHYLFLGFFIIILFAISVIGYIFLKSKRSVDKSVSPFFIICLAVFFILTIISIILPFTEYSFWIHIYNYVPGAGAIRALTRIWTASYLYLFLAIVIIASFVFREAKSVLLKVFLVILMLLSCLEQVNLRPYYYDKIENQKIQQQLDDVVYDKMKNGQADVFYVRWPDELALINYAVNLKAMWASLNLNIPTINGYSGILPKGYKSGSYPMSNEEIISWLTGNGVSPMIRVLVVDFVVNDDNYLINKTEIITLSADN